MKKCMNETMKKLNETMKKRVKQWKIA